MWREGVLLGRHRVKPLSEESGIQRCQNDAHNTSCAGGRHNMPLPRAS